MLTAWHAFSLRCVVPNALDLVTDLQPLFDQEGQKFEPRKRDKQQAVTQSAVRLSSMETLKTLRVQHGTGCTL